MVYGKERLLDDQYRLRLDYYELEATIQSEIDALTKANPGQAIFNLQGTKDFIKEFYQINGFKLDGVDYDLDLDLASFASLPLQSL
jgi:enoyl-[acyl-carrier protein] reductase/trans-2-enoyl-CoA reductase (NAD+)